jgi:hypothetical protein
MGASLRRPPTLPTWLIPCVAGRNPPFFCSAAARVSMSARF